VDAYAVENPHAAGYVMAYVPDARLGIVSDLYVPGAPVPSNAMVAALVKGVDKWGIKPGASLAATAPLVRMPMWFSGAKVRIPEPLRQHCPKFDCIASEPPAEPMLFQT